MSIKIYNGYKIQAQSLDSVVKTLYSLKSGATIEATKELLSMNLNIAIDMYDLMIINNTFNKKTHAKEKEKVEGEDKKFKPNLERSANVNAHGKIFNYLLDRDNRGNEEEHYVKLELTVFPEPVIIQKQKYYLFCMYGDRNLEKWFDSKFEECKITEYGYWDNTDPLEELTARQWNQREKHWNRVLVGKGKTGIPAIEGMSITLAKESKLYIRLEGDNSVQYMQEILDANPKMTSLEGRMREFLDQYTLSIVMKRVMKDQPKVEGDTAMQTSMEYYYDARKIIRENKLTEKEIVLIEEAKNNLINVLSPTLSLEDLNKPLQEVIDTASHKYNKVKKIKPQ